MEKINSDADEIVDYHESEKYQALMQKADLHLYDVMDHGINGEEKSKALEMIQKFLKKRRSIGRKLFLR